MLCENLTDFIGGTPLLHLKNIEAKLSLEANIFAKIESVNPCGSIKDRAALYMINDAVVQGRLKPGRAIIEPTSGNTGIAISAIAAAMGFKAIIVMPDSMSPERIKLMKAYGAEVVLTPGAEGMSGAIKKAEEIHNANEGSIVAGQFDNPANPRAHFCTTGPEIYRDLGGKIDIFTASVGSGGTFSGCARFLKEMIPEIVTVAAEPKASPLITEGKAGPHKIQGIGANMIPANYDGDYADEVLTVTDDDAMRMFSLIAETEGIFVGISSGANLCAAIELAKRPENKGKNIVTVFPDSGDRYLSLIEV